MASSHGGGGGDSGMSAPFDTLKLARDEHATFSKSERVVLLELAGAPRKRRLSASPGR
jgi:hypothetical protein